jgi:hypothetical protein
VVDDYSRLDRLTRDVLTTYLGDLQDRPSDHRAELWVIFDPSDHTGEALFLKTVLRMRREANLQGFAKAPYGIRRTQHFELAPLTDGQRYELAHLAGRPERARYRTVKAIVAEADDTLPKYFAEKISTEHPRENPATYAALELLYLLGLATVSGGGVEWVEGPLVRRLAEDKQRSTVLRQLLTGPRLSVRELTNRANGMREEFTRVVDVSMREREAYLSVSVEAGELLERSSGRFQLPDPGLGHLFWSLYRHDHRERSLDDPFWLGKLTHHLLRAASPRDHQERFGADTERLADLLFSAILDTVDDSLRLGQLRRVPELLQHATDVLAADNQRHRKRLFARVRDAYAVLADDMLLRMLLDLKSTEEPGPAADARSPLGLFVQATSTSGRTLQSLRAFAPGQPLAQLRTDAELRGTWLALSLQPFATTADNLLYVLPQAHLGIASKTSDILARQSDPSPVYEVADLVNLSLGLWCWALTGHGRRDMLGGLALPSSTEFPAALDAAYNAAAGLRQGAGPPRDADVTLDLVREGLAEELFTVVAAAALLVRAGGSPRGRRDAGELEDLIELSLEELSIRVPRRRGGIWLDDVADALLHRMTLLQITWRALGYAQLATVLNIRRTQLAALLPSTAAARLQPEGSERSLVEDRQRGDLLGLLANLATAERALPSEEEAAEVLVHGATVAIAGGISEELAVLVCLVALAHAHAYAQTDVHQPVGYLLSPSVVDPSVTRLDRLLDAVTDEHLEMVSSWFRNISEKEGIDTPPVDAAVERRVDRVTDEEIRTGLADQWRMHQLVRIQKSGQPIDAGEVLDAWASRILSNTYPYVLFRLAPPAGVPLERRLREEILRVLENYESYLSATGIVLLAHWLAQRAEYSMRTGRQSSADVPEALLIRVLRHGQKALAGPLSVEHNIRILEYLRSHDPVHTAEYGVDLEYWYRERLRLIEERELPDLLLTARYALLLLTYLEIFEDYGLQTGYAEGDRPVPADPRPDNALLRRAPAQPFFTVDGKPMLNGRFVADATRLFRSEIGNDPTFDDVRQDFNEAAEEALPQLFTFLIDLANIPAPIRAILRRHRDMVSDRLVAPARLDP